MPPKARSATSSLIEWTRPSESDGPLVGALLSTYGLSLDQPNFFGQDFLPTMLGLGGVRDRGYASPLTLDRALAMSDVTLICDAHALAGAARPTLRVDVLPIGHRTHHAKIHMIHRRNRIRLIISSANLTHEGFRRQREAAVVLDFYDGGALSCEVLEQALLRWEEVLGGSADEQVRRILADATRRARQWEHAPRAVDGMSIEVVFGGGRSPLWSQLVQAWPRGEPVRSWHVCSPFWPQVDRSAGDTPFEAIAHGLQQRGCSLDGCDLEVIARSDSPSSNALPRFPFRLVEHLRGSGFPVTRGRILPARLVAADDELSEGMAAENRELHAKWVVLAGDYSVVAMVGSANFTRLGMGVLGDPERANVEAGVLLRWRRERWHPRQWHPPIMGRTIDWASCGGAELRDPPPEESNAPEWAGFVQRIELGIKWERRPEPDGELRVHLRASERPPCRVVLPTPAEGVGAPPVAVEPDTPVACIPLTASVLRAVLARGAVEIRWSGGQRCCWFPVNVLQESKTGMPSVLGARPSEEQLLAYFHGRISEEDLLSQLEGQIRESTDPDATAPSADAEVLRRLQSYVVREFIESLHGLSRTLRDACVSPRAAEQAFMGDFSPVCLGEQVLQAFLAGRRSPTATAFQLVELIRVVCDVGWPDGEPLAPETARELEVVRGRTIDRLLALCEQAASTPGFARVISDPDFEMFTHATLAPNLAARWGTLVRRGPTEAVASRREGTT